MFVLVVYTLTYQEKRIFGTESLNQFVIHTYMTGITLKVRMAVVFVKDYHLI
jgi:hypothetical protein